MADYVLRDLIENSLDGEWGKGVPSPGHQPMACIRGTDFAPVRIGNLSSVPLRYVEVRKAARKELRPWDLLIEVAGGTKDQITGRTLLLRPQVFEKAAVPLTCASFSRFVRLRRDICEPEFVFWYLQSLYVSGAMHAYHTQHTGVARFQWTTFADREPIRLPALSVQRHIAGVLSTYDDLIENCERRIRVLDEMARALYREWFVCFRYPGHDPARVTIKRPPRLPAGWADVTLGSLVDSGKASLQTGPFGTQLKAEHYSNDGTPVINVRNIGEGSVRQEKLEYLSAERALEQSRHALDVGDIVFGRKGAVDRHILVTSRERGWIQGSDCIRLRFVDDACTPYLLSYAFREEDHKRWMLAHCSGAATMASLNVGFAPGVRAAA